MTIIEKMKLIFRSAKPLGKFVGQLKGSRAKYKTIPFWISIIGSLISIAGAFVGLIPATTAIVITSLLGAAYNVLRGLDKMSQEGVKPPLKSTEFWVGMLAIVSASLMEMQSAGISSGVLTFAIAAVAAAMAIAQNLGAQQPKDIQSPSQIVTTMPVK